MAISSSDASPPIYSFAMAYDKSVHPDHQVLHRSNELFYISWYIRQGKAEIISGGETLYAHAGQWVFYDPLCVRTHRLTDSPVLISIRFRITWRGLDYLPPLSPIRIVSGEDKPELLAAAEALCRANETHPNPTSTAYFRRQALFYNWLEHWRRERETLGMLPETPADPRVFEILECLAGHMSIQPIDYPALQRAVGLSRAQINRVFLKGTGLSPRQWMVARCLDEAQQQINHSGRSLKEIAADLGFFDASHFTRWYRQQTGQSPTDWRTRQAL